MKLTCVLTIAALFLTACQLITASSDTRDLQEFPRRKRSHRTLKKKAEEEPCIPGGLQCDVLDDKCCNSCSLFWCT
uniref:Ctr_38_TN conopeptide n=2 Tax=Conus tribblei TaxID=101761 RepID=A0A0C9R728_CONTD